MSARLTSTEMEETLVWVEAAKRRDSRAANLLLERFAPLLDLAARNIAKKTGDIETARSDVNYILVKAIRNWNPDRGRFVPYLNMALATSGVLQAARSAAFHSCVKNMDIEQVASAYVEVEDEIADQLDEVAYARSWGDWVEAVAATTPEVFHDYVFALKDCGRIDRGLYNKIAARCDPSRQLSLWTEIDIVTELVELVAEDGWALIQRRAARWSMKRILADRRLSREGVRCLIELLKAWVESDPALCAMERTFR